MTMDAKFDRFWASFEPLLERLSHQEGLPVRLGGETATALYRQLVSSGKILPSDTIAIAGPDSALEYANQTTVGLSNVARATGETEIDHRGIRLPSRHRAGGIITPQ
jgi:hypothetical protein